MILEILGTSKTKPIAISHEEMYRKYKREQWWMVYSFFRFCELMQRSGGYHIFDYDRHAAMHKKWIYD